MNYPKSLNPQSKEFISISRDKTIEISKALLHFEKWSGKPLEDNYNKIVLDYNNEPLFAELIILRFFQNDGWEGVWVDTYRKKFRLDWNNKNGIELPLDKMELLNDIYKRIGKSGGCWDIFCWKGDKILFAESKYSKKDKLRNNQINFLKAGLEIGIETDSFLLVEWSLA